MELQVLINPWVSGVDCAFDLIAIIVALLLTLFAYKIYLFCKIREYKFFSLAFLAIAGSFFFKILTHISLHKDPVLEVVTNTVSFAVHSSTNLRLAFIISIFAWRALFLAGFLLYYVLLDKSRNNRQLFLSLYFATAIAALSIYQSVVFYITSAIVFVFIVYMLYINSQQNKAKHVSAVFYAFTLLLAAQVTFIFVSLHKNIYFVGEILQLVGFGLLLANYVLLMKRKC